jgi:S1-C subfamily serine protease
MCGLILGSMLFLSSPSWAYYCVYGTAFFINDKGTLLTTSHMARGLSRLNIKYQGHHVPVKVIWISTRTGVAILQTNLKNTKYFGLQTCFKYKNKKVCLAGYPGVIPPSYKQNSFSNPQLIKFYGSIKNSNMNTFVSKIMGCEGNSGSPCYTPDYRVVGVEFGGKGELGHGMCSRDNLMSNLKLFIKKAKQLGVSWSTQGTVAADHDLKDAIVSLQGDI